MKLLTILLFVLCSNFLMAQSQIGSTITGDFADDRLGYGLALNNRGTTMAVGASHNDSNGTNSGYVKIYDLINSTWVQRGLSIFGDSIDVYFGQAVALSANGNRVAIGSPEANIDYGVVKVYEWNGILWNLLGSSLSGPFPIGYFGIDVDLDYDGSTLVVGAPHSDSARTSNKGDVFIYDYQGNNWVQRGQKIRATSFDEWLGSSVNIDSSGNIVGAGSRSQDNINGYDAGAFSVYFWSGSSWVQRGNSILGKNAGDRFGWFSDMTADGKTCIVSSVHNDSIAPRAGAVYVYAWNGLAWVQKGQTLYGGFNFDYFGRGVAINAKGNKIGIGADRENSTGQDAGQVKAYEFINNSWVQSGTNINGAAMYDRFGTKVTLDSTGDVLAASAPFNSDFLLYAGHARVFNLRSSTVGQAEVELNNNIHSVSPNPFEEHFVIKMRKVHSGELRLYSLAGELVLEQHFSKTNQLKVNYQGKSGRYLLQLIYLDGTTDGLNLLKL